MKSKKALMGYAALLVLFFHFYKPLTGAVIENFLYKTAYIGVDIFFFVSAASLGSRGVVAFVPFMKNRLKKVYLPFVLFSVLAAVYKKWSVTQLLKVVFFAELFTKGGGSFLWFLPGIMLMYLLIPLLSKLKQKNVWLTLVGALVAWAALGCILQFGFKYTDIFILLNRFPVFVLGFFYDDFAKHVPSLKVRLPLMAVLLAGGIAITYKTGFLKPVNVPFKDMYFVLAIPMTLGVILLFEIVYTYVPVKLHVLDFVGLLTLEVYALQMTFGYDIMSALMKMMMKDLGMTNRKAILCLSFLGVVLILIAGSYLIYLVKSWISKLTKARTAKKNGAAA